MKKKHKRRYDSRKKQPVNLKHKDRLFRLAFQSKKDMLSLYNAVNGTDYQNPEELEVTTLEDAVFLGVKNDLSFIIGATLNLYEHQSTWNMNMPLRGLIYFSGLYQQYVEANGYNLYGSRRISLPFPQYLVFYNGDSEEPDRQELTLSEAFQEPGRKLLPGVECRVQVLNINRGHNRDLMDKCRRLQEYAEFIALVKENLQKGMERRKAIVTAMDDCRSRGILEDILSRCRTEVLHMLLAEYDEKATMEYIRKESREIGFEEGEKSGEKKGLKKGMQKGMRLLLELCQELGLSREEACRKLCEKYELSEEKAEIYVKEYWK